MNFKLKSLALAVGLSSATVALPSYALIITSTVESSASITVNGVSYTSNDGPGSTTSSSIVGEVINPARNMNPYAGNSTATGDASGNSSLRSNGPWYLQTAWLSSPFTMSTSSNLTHKAVITNDSAVAQNLDFNFLITAGTITSHSEQIQGANYVNAGYSANILINGISQWNSSAKATHDGLGKSVSLNGSNLGGTVSEDWYSWDNHNDSLHLGLLNAGQSITIEYNLSTYVNEYFQDDGYSYTPYASIGDPFDFSTSPLFGEDKFVASTTTPPTHNVPEPSGALLLGVGAAALAFRRRSKKA